MADKPEKYNRTGLLYIQGGFLRKAWQPKYFSIVGKHLLITKDSNPDGKTEFNIHVSDFIAADAIDEYRDLSFNLRTNSKTLVVRGSEDEDPQEWVRTFLLWRKYYR